MQKVSQGLNVKYIEPLRNATKTKILQISQSLIVQYVEPLRNETKTKVVRVSQGLTMQFINPMLKKVEENMRGMREKIQTEYRVMQNDLRQKMKTLEVLNPEKVLRQGYAIISGKISPGEKEEIVVGDVVKTEIRAIVPQRMVNIPAGGVCALADRDVVFIKVAAVVECDKISVNIKQRKITAEVGEGNIRVEVDLHLVDRGEDHQNIGVQVLCEQR